MQIALNNMRDDATLYKTIEQIITKTINKLNLNNKPIYTRDEVLKLLDVDAKTLKRYQDEGLIAYSQPIAGGKVFFTAKDIDEFMANSHNEAFYFKGL